MKIEMKSTAHSSSRPQDLGQRLSRTIQACVTALFVSLMGTGSASAVSVSQDPLIIQQSLPPNVLMLLDDSGSMGWDYMPDYSYMADTSLSGFQSPSVNYVYYNPDVTYEPPKRADGGSYPEYTFPWVPNDGFRDASDLDYIEGYESSYIGGFDYFRWLDFNGDACADFGADTSNKHDGYCYSSDSNLSGTLAFYDPENEYYYYYGDGDRRVFSYSLPDNNGYEEYYVTASCDGLTGNTLDRCDDSAEAKQNVANWFAYYRTRMLSAKSGLMNAFADLDPSFRVGFGAINGNRADWIRGITSGGGECGDAFSTSCRFGFDTSTETYNEIAGVVDWGDGSNGTRKAQFYQWLNDEYSSGGTPLRETLQAAGEYYREGQPWMSQDDNGTHEYSCRQAYTILTSDGFWNGGSPSVGNVDGTNGATLGAENDGRILAPNGIEYYYDAVAPFSDSYSNTLADVAMYYWKNDLRPTVDNQVPTTDEDPAFWQHMTTFSVGLGFDALYDDGSVIDTGAVFDWANGGDAITGFQWPSPSDDDIDNIADMLHAGVNGHGGFYSAKNPQEFASAIADALGRAAERVGTGASLAANSTRLETGTVTYQANYFTGAWVGDLKAYTVDPTTKQIATNANWSAADNLLAAPAGSCTASGGEICPASRTIYTFDVSAVSSNNDDGYREFVAGELSNLSSGQQAALGSTTTEQTAVLNFLRGDATNAQDNGGNYRSRSTALGDIVNSQPVYVGKPDTNLFTARSFTGVDEYAAFAANQAARTPTVYVSSNDGMLHGFNANTGTETYAYLPGAVIEAGVSDLADPNYGANPDHQFFNDGELTVADVYLPTNGNNGEWATILVGTSGRGEARVVYALDVTDPSDIQFLWERSATDGLSGSDYIGQMIGKPLIVQTADAEWSVLIGNGYNSAQDKAALLEFDVETGDLTVYQTDSNTDNGLAAPASFDYQTSPDGIQDVAYAGDLNGRVWRFDLDGGTVSNVYQALDDSSNAQPITAGMLLGKDPATSDLWAFFGTGKYLAQSDLTDMSVQTWYGLVVESGTTGRAVTSSSSRSDLIEREILAETTASGSTLAARAFSKGTAGDISDESGWYMDLVSPTNGAEGERMVEPNQFQGTVLVGTSIIPEAADVCNPSGRGFVMGLDPFDGTNVDQAFVDYNGSGAVDGSDTITVNGEQYAVGAVGFTRMPNAPIFVGNTMLISFDDGSTGSIETSGGGGAGQRTSWREIVVD